MCFASQFFEKRQYSDRIPSNAQFHVVPEFLDTGNEFPMLHTMFVQFRVLCPLQQSLLCQKVSLRVFFQFTHDVGEDGPALPGLHGGVQIIDQSKQFLMFGIAAFDVDAIRRIPGN
jgi:hypothetical protein